MHDIRLIRRDPDAFKGAMALRGVAAEAVDAVLAADAARRAAETEAQRLQARRNELARLVGAARKAGREAAEALAEARAVGERLGAAEAEARAAGEGLAGLMAGLPNAPLPGVPVGRDEAANVVVRAWGAPRTADDRLAHWATGPALGLDAEAGAEVAGARFAVLRGPLARVERALGQFMLDLHAGEHGYEEVSVPLLVRPEALFGTGQLPKFAGDLFAVGDKTLIPTAEVPLTNLVRARALDGGALPLRMTALTPCFRAEAGSAGRDVRGLVRQHQFHKVELVSVTAPEDAAAELDRMVRCAAAVLERLELPHRVVELCTGDLGFSAARTFDLEVWMPGQGAYREISSCSTCGDFQARRMGTRLARRADLPHTLNGSGVAVGRALAALVENHATGDGAVRVPAALRPYLGGADTVRPARA